MTDGKNSFCRCDATSEVPGCQALETAFIGPTRSMEDVLFCHHAFGGQL